MENQGTQNQDNFFDLIKDESTGGKSRYQPMTSKYETNEGAEAVVSTLGQIIFGINILAGAGCFIYGLSLLGDRYGSELAGTLIVVGILLVLVGAIQWAFIQLFVNMSRNLFKLNATFDAILRKSK